MARKLRVEFPGAVYHVINRGNYRADIFATAGARAAFGDCLAEVCGKSGWRLHAWVLMRNHYHLALETPQGNLVAGMQWLQATFANRFNRLRGERGHLFQGRYKALLVEPGAGLGQLCHYIHLNPVRAGVASVGQLQTFRDSSYWVLWRPQERPGFYLARTALAQAGGLADTLRGRRAYQKFLAWQATHGPAGRNTAFVSMSRGWILGSDGFRETVLKDHALAADSRTWEHTGKTAIRAHAWQQALTSHLRRLGRAERDLRAGPLAQPWKVQLARRLKTTTQASNRWLADKFGSTSPVYVSKLVSQARHPNPQRPAASSRMVKR